MNHLSDAPADTRMMGIVHDALRRDLARATTALAADDRALPRAEAIGTHLAWAMDFLHEHHAGEDAGLWPLVRERDPSISTLVDELEADHARIAPLVTACRTAALAHATGASDDTARTLLDALERLSAVLVPHLDREEAELMPAVSVSLTAAEWRAVDQEHFIEPKSLAQLGVEGHWLLDGLDAERAALVLHQVGFVSRQVLVHGFGRRYRRQAVACWGPGEYGPAPALPISIPLTGGAEAVVPAPIDAVWAVVADVTRIGEWSHECRGAVWLGGATEAVPGARFRGTNRAGMMRWSRVNEVLEAQAPHRFVWRTVSTLRYPDSSEWRIELAPEGTGTRITQSYRVLRAPKLLSKLYALAVPNHRGRSGGLTDDLRRLGEVAAGHTAAATTAVAS